MAGKRDDETGEADGGDQQSDQPPDKAPEQGGNQANQTEQVTVKPAGVDEPARFDDADHYRTGLEQVRTTATWVMTALGAVAAVVFGGGPLVATDKITGEQFDDRIGWLLVTALVGAGAIVFLIGRAAQVLMPARVSLDKLPQELLDEIAEESSAFLPADASTVEEFSDWRRQESLGFRDAQKTLAKHQASIGGLERRQQQGRLSAEEQAQLAQLRREQGILKAHLPVFRQNLDIAERAKAYLLIRAEYTTVRNKFTKVSFGVGFAAVLATVAAVGYIAAWKWQPEADTPAPSTLATLARVDNAAGSSLWTNVGLDECAPDGVVTVLRDGGDGTPEAPYQVRTLGHDGCPLASFTVISQAATLVVPTPAKVSIEYEPATTTVAPTASEPSVPATTG